jgi:hypothetical protein
MSPVAYVMCHIPSPKNAANSTARTKQRMTRAERLSSKMLNLLAAGSRVIALRVLRPTATVSPRGGIDTGVGRDLLRRQ